MILSFRTDRSGQTVQTQIRGAVWSGSTLFAIPAAFFGYGKVGSLSLLCAIALRVFCAIATSRTDLYASNRKRAFGNKHLQVALWPQCSHETSLRGINTCPKKNYHSQLPRNESTCASKRTSACLEKNQHVPRKITLNIYSKHVMRRKVIRLFPPQTARPLGRERWRVMSNDCAIYGAFSDILVDAISTIQSGNA